MTVHVNVANVKIRVPIMNVQSTANVQSTLQTKREKQFSFLFAANSRSRASAPDLNNNQPHAMLNVMTMPTAGENINVAQQDVQTSATHRLMKEQDLQRKLHTIQKPRRLS